MRNEEIGAGNETRTRDPNLGKVVLYQLSYSRLRVRIMAKYLFVSSDSTTLFSIPSAHCRSNVDDH